MGTAVLVTAVVQSIVDKANSSLARYEQIKYFRILPEEVSVENGLLTPTLKLKRRSVEERYEDWLDGMYGQGGSGATLPL